MQAENYQNFNDSDKALEFFSKHQPKSFIECYSYGSPWKFRVYYWDIVRPIPPKQTEE